LRTGTFEIYIPRNLQLILHFDNHHVKVDQFCHHFRNSPVSRVVVASFSRSLHHQRCKAKKRRPEIAIPEVAGCGGGGGGGQWWWWWYFCLMRMGISKDLMFGF